MSKIVQRDKRREQFSNSAGQEVNTSSEYEQVRIQLPSTARYNLRGRVYGSFCNCHTQVTSADFDYDQENCYVIVLMIISHV